MANIMFHSDTVQIGPLTVEDLDDIEFEIGSYEPDVFALALSDDADLVAIVGGIDRLQEFVDGLNQQMIKLRRYHRSLARAKARLEDRLKS